MPSYSRARRVGERFPIRNSAVGGVLIDRQRLQRMRVDFVSEHDLVGAEAGHAGAVVGIVMLEISDEARYGELDLDAELGASNALERAASRSSFSMRPPGTFPGPLF